MPALRVLVDNLEEIEEPFRDLYTEKDGKFTLNLDDDVKKHPKVLALSTAVERLKREKQGVVEKLTAAETKLAELPEGFDPDKYAEEQDELTALRAKKDGKDTTDDEARQSQKKLYEQRIAKMEEKHAAEKAALEKNSRELEGQIEKVMGDEGLTKALVAAGVDKKLLPGATALLRKSVKVARVDGNGEWRAFIATDTGEATIDEFVTNWAQSDEGGVYIEKAKGGDSKGGNGSKLGENPFASSADGKVKPNLTKQQEMIMTNPERARALARAAGYPVTW